MPGSMLCCAHVLLAVRKDPFYEKFLFLVYSFTYTCWIFSVFFSLCRSKQLYYLYIPNWMHTFAVVAFICSKRTKYNKSKKQQQQDFFSFAFRNLKKKFHQSTFMCVCAHAIFATLKRICAAIYMNVYCICIKKIFGASKNKQTRTHKKTDAIFISRVCPLGLRGFHLKSYAAATVAFPSTNLPNI